MKRFIVSIITSAAAGACAFSLPAMSAGSTLDYLPNGRINGYDAIQARRNNVSTEELRELEAELQA